MRALGDEFRAAREARHLSFSDVSEQIHIRSVYLQSIEDEDWGAIAAPVYVRGFVRTYARFLGLDAESAVQHYNAAIGDAGIGDPAAGASRPVNVTRSSITPGPREDVRRGPSLWIWLGGGVAAILVAFVVITYVQSQTGSGDRQPVARASSPARAAASAAARPVESAAPSADPAAAGRSLVVRTSQRSWLRVEVDGRAQAEGIFPAGTEKTFHGRQVEVRAGNAAGVSVVLNGKDLGALGPAGEVVDRTFNLAQE
jgi:cytoskeletal protein RodZ